MNTKNRIGLAVVVATVVASFLPLGCAHGQHDLGQASLTFGDFLQAYGKEYSAAEYATRKTLYEKRRFIFWYASPGCKPLFF